MVWKFGSVDAQESHDRRLGRLEPAVDTAPAPALALAPRPSTAMPPREGRIEPVLLAQEAFLAARGIKLTPAPALAELAVPAPVDLSDPVQYDAAAPALPVILQIDLPVHARYGETVTQMDVEDFPHSALTWDMPAFAGGPDDLPDLRPTPAAPMAHPGLEFSGHNTFGHALRLPAEDERQLLWADQRRDRGFDDTELWGLDDAFSRFILPRLKALRQQKLESPGVKMELTVWYGLIDKMIRAFELLLPDGGGAWSRGTLTDRERAQVQEGLDLFRQYFFSLCW